MKDEISIAQSLKIKGWGLRRYKEMNIHLMNGHIILDSSLKVMLYFSN